ncbi:hypothetical protein [Streptomyces rubiginosohelvolus]|uniref:hypothetical protein n=1 Tax=Streptomyces rubiginosohelvolus TaxID=67362 RepID=UPI0033A0A188
MSAYSAIYQALVKGGMSATEAANRLGELRSETGAELSAGLLARATEMYGQKPTDSNAVKRRRTARFGAVRDAAAWLITATSTGRLTTTPQQRDPRSNT